MTYKLLAYALLFPLVSLLLGRMIAWTGRTVVADEDILQFVREPLGWLCLVVISALFVAILALEQVA